MIATKDMAISIGDLWDKYRHAVDSSRDVRWPLAPLVNAWQQRPRPVEPNRRTTDRIIPGRLAMADTSNNPRLLFSPAAHAEYGPDGSQLVLPGFANAETPSPALPLALYDLGAGPTISRGKAAPLALRMFVEAVLSVRMHERERGQPVAMSVALREFLQWLYPTRAPTPAEYWPKLMRAIDALDSRSARVPLYDPHTKRSELRRIVSVGGIPRGPGALDESVRIIVDLPPGSGNGPQVSDRLRLWGLRSGPAYRLLINLAYQWHRPGVTKIPLRRGKPRHWVQVNDPDRYPYISDQDLVMLASRHQPSRIAACYCSEPRRWWRSSRKPASFGCSTPRSFRPSDVSLVQPVGPDAATIANCYARVHHDHLSTRSSPNIKLIVSEVFALLLPPRRHTRPPPPSRAQGTTIVRYWNLGSDRRLPAAECQPLTVQHPGQLLR